MGGERYYERLDEHALGDGPPLVVLGESGVGKSALLANWAHRYRGSHADDLVLLHFCGASPTSADWSAMLRRIMGELGRRRQIPGKIPDGPAALRAAFGDWLQSAAAKGRIVLIIDGLNQMEDRTGALDLVWLPLEIPTNVRLILSTLPGRPLDELKRRGWPALVVQPLAVEERRRLVVDYLAQYSKSLSPARAQRVVTAPQCANPLYLRVLLEELRLFGLHERLDERIGHYLAAGTIVDLYEKVLARYEADYDRDRPWLVEEAMSLLWAARRGLSEAELLDMLGREGQPLPRAFWSPLFLAAEASLVDRWGLLSFSHDYLRQAVRRRYLSSTKAPWAAHMRLADYFHGRDLGPRRLDEEPWQLAQSQEWRQLAELLGDMTFFYAAWQRSSRDVMARWLEIEANSPYRMTWAYRNALIVPDIHNLDRAWRLGLLLTEAGHTDEALNVWSNLAEIGRALGERKNAAHALYYKATLQRDRGDWAGALASYEESESICRTLGDEADAATAVGGRASVLQAQGAADEALALYREAERQFRELGDKARLARSLGDQATILRLGGDRDGAMARLREEEQLCRELGDRAGMRRSQAGQALILQDQGDLGKAVAFWKEQQAVCHEMGDKFGLLDALENQARLCHRRGNLEEALALYQESEWLFREMRNKVGLSQSLGDQALVMADCGDLDTALALHRESVRLWRETGARQGLAVSLLNQASLLGLKMNQPAKALPLADEAHRLATEGGWTSLVQQIDLVRAAILRQPR